MRHTRIRDQPPVGSGGGDRARLELDEEAIDAFREIAAAHAEYLHGIAVRFVRDRDTAKDLVQETLARGLVRFAQFKRGTNVRAWLTKILTRLFLDELKHEQVVAKAERELVTLEDIDGEIDDAVADVPDPVLWAAVELLGPELREIVEQRYVLALGYKQLADRLGIPVGTVGTRLMRAHARLRELLLR